MNYEMQTSVEAFERDKRGKILTTRMLSLEFTRKDVDKGIYDEVVKFIKSINEREAKKQDNSNKLS
jgi:hypothetical protein